MQLLASMTGIKLIHAPYKGSLPALNDIIGGHVQMMFSDMSAALPLIQSGKVRALGISTAKRSAEAPEIPTVAEGGVPGYDAAAWQMVIAADQDPERCPRTSSMRLCGIPERRASSRRRSPVVAWSRW